ncbi:MAG TPA: hypothetical protein H9895_04725 [Candidatus Pseudogracilibacillus intestinigallinarum]|uniref:Uncharacterized protein n=1 Tax=Candidatus Pseudogracilibacillus intestinigallinarum TaxID=2838742 RepID=A0A9D1PL20_9BACI|nr:hypothetical protein [Candidatus Pseudogracilibacillus intestinigallinarum]
MQKIVKQSILFAVFFIIILAGMKLFLGKPLKMDIIWQGILTAFFYWLFLTLDRRHDERKKNRNEKR